MKNYILHFFKSIICVAVILTIGLHNGVAETNVSVDQTTEQNINIINDQTSAKIISNISTDLKQFAPTAQNIQLVDDFVPIEAKVGLALMHGLSLVGHTLDISLFRFAIIFMIIMYAFWIMAETYKMMQSSSSVKELIQSIIRYGIKIVICIIILNFGPAKIFMTLATPIILFGTYVADMFLNTVANFAGLQIPDTCNAIIQYASANTSPQMLITPDAAAGLMCIPTRLAGFFYTGVAAGFQWMLAGFGTSAFTFIIGLAFVILFILAAFKFAFIGLGVILDLFLSILLLPFTAIAETTAKTKYDGIVGDIINKFMGIFKTDAFKLESVIKKFINASLYYISMAVSIGLCGALLSWLMPIDIQTHTPTLADNSFITTLLSICFVIYFIDKFEEYAKAITGKIDDGSKIAQQIRNDLTNTWNSSKKQAENIWKIIKDNL